MPGIHRLQQVIAALIAYLAHDDAVGTMAQSGGKSWLGVTATWPGIASTASQRTALGCAIFSSAGCSMTTSRSCWGTWSRNAFIKVVFPEPVPPLMMPFFRSVMKLDDLVPNVLRQAARSNQLIGGVPAVEFADGEGRPIDGRWSADDCHTRAVRQACIQDRILGREVLSKDARDTLNRRLQPVVRVWRRERDMLDHAVPIRVDAGGAVNHQVGDGRVEQERPQLLGKEREDQVGSSSRRSCRMALPAIAGDAALASGRDGIDGDAGSRGTP